MSDSADAQHSSAVRRALVQCTGGPGCPRNEPSPSPLSSGGSPWRSRSEEGDDTDSCFRSTTPAFESEDIEAGDVALAMASLQEEVMHTKRVAHRAYMHRLEEVRNATIDKIRMMYVIYGLLAVIFFLVLVIVHKS